MIQSFSYSRLFAIPVSTGLSGLIGSSVSESTDDQVSTIYKASQVLLKSFLVTLLTPKGVDLKPGQFLVDVPNKTVTGNSPLSLIELYILTLTLSQFLYTSIGAPQIFDLADSILRFEGITSEDLRATREAVFTHFNN